jgi:hypothetical protein
MGNRIVPSGVEAIPASRGELLGGVEHFNPLSPHGESWVAQQRAQIESRRRQCWSSMTSR